MNEIAVAVEKCPSFPLPIPKPSDEVQVYPSTLVHSPSFQSQLSTSVVHPALIVPAHLTAECRRRMSSLLMHRPKVKDVYPIEDNDVLPGIDRNFERKLVLKLSLGHHQGDGEPNDMSRTYTAETDVYHHPTVHQLLQPDTNQPQSHSIRISTHVVTLGYEQFTTEQVLRRILPPLHTLDDNGPVHPMQDTNNPMSTTCNNKLLSNADTYTEIPSAFEVIGYVAHVNLRDEYLPFRYIIGQVLLDKNKNLKIVVNKVGSIENQFRTFTMQVIAIAPSISSIHALSNVKSGDICDTLPVELKECGCKFHLDFAKVYWNSRLQYEHKRLVQSIAKTKRSMNHEVVVVDACAGVGPFAVPLACQYDTIKVYANDLNPISYQYLTLNGEKNKCPKSHYKTYNMDSRDFIRHLDEVEHVHYDHVVMNLPSIAPEFLCVFRGWKGDYSRRPMIHVYCFGGKDETVNKEVMARCSQSLGCTLSMEKDEVSIHIVRDVSPKKNMLCISFRLPEEVRSVERVDVFDTGKTVQEEDINDMTRAKKARIT